MLIAMTNFEALAPEVLSRAEMLEVLLSSKHGVCGMVLPVGSEPSSNSFDDVVKVEVERSGLVSWTQGRSKLEGMDVQPYYHPDLGLVLEEIIGPSGGVCEMITLESDPEKIAALVEALGSEEGIDLHPDAAPRLYELYGRREDLEPEEGQKQGEDRVPEAVRCIKTHISTPANSRYKLDPRIVETLRRSGALDLDSIEGFQELYYNALVRGHLTGLREISPVVIVSMDNPSPFEISGLLKDIDSMFTENKAIRAFHCCGAYEILRVMDTRRIDLVHFDAETNPDLVRGDPVVVDEYLERGGMFGWGGIPQTKQQLIELAKKEGLTFEDLMEAYLDAGGKFRYRSGTYGKDDLYDVFQIHEYTIDKHSIEEWEGRIPKGDKHDQEVQKFYQPAINLLFGNMDRVVGDIYEKYKGFLDNLVTEHVKYFEADDESEFRKNLMKQTFISTTCGYGPNNVDGLRAFSYEVARRVAGCALEDLKRLDEEQKKEQEEKQVGE